MRAARRRAASWKRRAKRAALAAMLAAGMSASSTTAEAQYGGMPPNGGVLNRAATRFGQRNQNGPGWMYFGINPADRGLGYNGGYITLGGFIPYAEDNYGGFWAADLRGHLSEYGGFFSNVGAVRKQFVGGTLMGLGVYWDYDGDQSQYPTGGLPGTEIFGQFSQSYNQVGVSGEWLTDLGNFRTNGYIPVGQTAMTVGDPGIPFYQNNVLCDYGLDAALGGADMEIGAYIPSLAEWAGMINVGGYALGNTRYNWDAGTDAGQAVVPWFGGVYTRLDMTFANNWDFSIQYNNDSYFDSTGFIRLTYRMGGSRRRNVPDQVEQPMWRNEHIVRAHQTPVVVYNPVNSSLPWRAIHVDNSAAAGGNGTFESPFQTLAEADAVATNAWDIVYVHEGLSTSSSASPGDLYGGTFSFNAPNQFLVGSGGDLIIEGQANCGVNGLVTIDALTTNNPVLSDPGAPSINLNGQGGVTVANLTINGSQTGIFNNTAASLDGTAQRFGTTANPFNTTISQAGGSSVRNVIISGDGSTNLQKGVSLTNATGGIEFSDTAIGNMNNIGFQIGDGTASSGGTVNVNYFGRISNNTSFNGGIPSLIIDINNMTGGEVNLAYRGAPSGTTISNEILDVGGEGILIEANGDATYATSPTINIGNATLINSVSTAIAVVDDYSTTTVETVPNILADPSYTAGIIKNTDGAAIVLLRGAPNFTYFGDIVNSPTAGGPLGYLAQIAGVENATGTANIITISGPGVDPLLDQGDGLFINNVAGNTTVNFTGLDLQGTGTTGILLENSQAAGGFDPTFNFFGTQIGGTTAGPSGEGVLLAANSVGTSINFANLDIALSGTNARGFMATNGATINAVGANTLLTGSTTAAAIYIYSDTAATNLNTLNFTSVVSANPETALGERAITIDDGATLSTGTININGTFGIGTDPATATPGTTNNITNNSAAPVEVFVNGVQISP